MLQAADTFDSNRLSAAADALLRAIASPGGFETTVEASVGGAGRAGSLPSGLFTIGEYIEAMQMLVRNGLVIRSEDRRPVNECSGSDFTGVSGRVPLLRPRHSGATPMASLLLNAPGPQRCGSGGLLGPDGLDQSRIAC